MLVLSGGASGLDAESFAIALVGAAVLIVCWRYGRLLALALWSRRGGTAGPAERPRLVLIEGGKSEERSGAGPTLHPGGGGS